MYIIYKILLENKATLEIDQWILQKYDKIMIQDKIKLSKVQESIQTETSIKSQKQTLKNIIKIIQCSSPQLKLNTGHNK